MEPRGSKSNAVTNNSLGQDFEVETASGKLRSLFFT